MLSNLYSSLKNNLRGKLKEINFEKLIFEISIFIIISCALFLGKVFIFQNALVVGFIITSLLFFVDARISFFISLILLIGVMFSVGFKKDALAETLAIYVYYFMCIGVFTELVQTLFLSIKEKIADSEVLSPLTKWVRRIFGKIKQKINLPKTPRIKISYEITWK